MNLLMIVAFTVAGVLADCQYSAYGCTYFIWSSGSWGEAAVTCDEGESYAWYTGRVGGCPR